MSDAVLNVTLPPPRHGIDHIAGRDNAVWILQLAPLASQHHLSEYSRIKYGHQGCPILYAPLSLHLPDVVHALRERQRKYADQVLWWPCTSPTARANMTSSPLIPAAMQRTALATGKLMSHPELQQELSNALSEFIPIQSIRQDIKTSESHPIHISQIIPPELLLAISSHLTPCKRPCPVLFEIHLPYSLDRIAGHSLRVHDVSALTPPSSRSSVTTVLNAALNTRISLPPLPVSTSRILLSFKRNNIVPDGAPQDNVADEIANPILLPIPLASQASSNHTPSALPLPYALHPFSSHICLPTAPSSPNKFSKFRSSTSSTTSSRQVTVNQKPFKLGNLLVSSCPGKKVRLSGPVRGRSVICRDLDIDLRRMKMLGARCIVCCLDDEELEFLIGVSWIEYCQVAHRQGLDVLRIPLPEGLAPLSPKSLDADLERIIEKYSLHGISVLVHCRGGIGRAGLFACCWMLKLGLCGWIETDLPSGAAGSTMSEIEIKHDDSSKTFQWDNVTVVGRDTLQLVERVIEVVRRRRSVKAIETLEQVQFLVEYVDHLRTSGTQDSSNP